MKIDVAIGLLMMILNTLEKSNYPEMQTAKLHISKAQDKLREIRYE